MKSFNIPIVIENICRTMIAAFLFCTIWTQLECYLYGEVQYRTVDDIMMVIFLPFIYRAVEIRNPLQSINR